MKAEEGELYTYKGGTYIFQEYGRCKCDITGLWYDAVYYRKHNSGEGLLCSSRARWDAKFKLLKI